jgi:poly-gamma-glutamate synthesis protein (capsule biosynthesis protein)
MDELSEHNFLSRIQEYSSTISDTTLLNAKWKEYCRSKRIDYFSKILGSNKVVKQLMKRNIFTSFWARKTKRPTILNILRCESHRDVILENLEEIYQNIGRK